VRGSNMAHSSVLAVVRVVRGLVVRTPESFIPQSPHFGALPFFLTLRYLCSPPGVRMMRTLFETVLYGCLLRCVSLH